MWKTTGDETGMCSFKNGIYVLCGCRSNKRFLSVQERVLAQKGLPLKAQAHFFVSLRVRDFLNMPRLKRRNSSDLLSEIEKRAGFGGEQFCHNGYRYFFGCFCPDVETNRTADAGKFC